MSRHTVKVNISKLRGAIRSKGYTIKSFTQKLGIDRGTFHAYLRDVCDVPFTLIEKMASTLDVDEYDIIQETEKIEYEFRKMAVEFVYESEFKRRAGDKTDLEHLRVLMGISPYVMAKKVSVESSHDMKEIAEFMKNARESVVNPNATESPEVTPEVQEVFTLLEGETIEEPVSEQGNQQADD